MTLTFPQARKLLLIFSTIAEPTTIPSDNEDIILPILGDIVAKDKDAYKYLSESIDLFPTQDELTEILISSGFENIKSINLFNGIVAIHTGYKI